MAQELGDLTGSLRDRNRQLRDARRQLTDLANVDELTGLGNRRLVNTVLQDEINRACAPVRDLVGDPAGCGLFQELQRQLWSSRRR